MCDNTDCEGNGKKLFRVEMSDEFEGGIVEWCDKCIERDSSFIEKVYDEVK
jgi:hypothetical protein